MIEVSHLQKCLQKLSHLEAINWRVLLIVDLGHFSLCKDALSYLTDKGSVKAECALQDKLQEITITWYFLMTDSECGKESWKVRLLSLFLWHCPGEGTTWLDEKVGLSEQIPRVRKGALCTWVTVAPKNFCSHYSSSGLCQQSSSQIWSAWMSPAHKSALWF